jgi:ABC-type transporter Mla subunit MlaD
MNAMPEKIENNEIDDNLAAVTDAEATVNNVNTLIQRVAGASASEIDTLITELENLRGFMHEEGQRVQRELASFAQLSQTAMKSTRMISDSIAQWKRPSEQ